MRVSIGTAGWALGQAAKPAFPGEGSNLERYARVLPVTEINSSFHRAHRPATWERWRDSVPEDFRFSVKVPKTITHERGLASYEQLLSEFLAQVELLGEKLAILLVQLPPKLSFDPQLANGFLKQLRAGTAASIALEPRHPTWFAEPAESLLAGLQISRVAADPAICPSAAIPGGWRSLAYWRLHGSPLKYRSSYQDRLSEYATALRAKTAGAECWCIFDNTASSAAIADALQLDKLLDEIEVETR